MPRVLQGILSHCPETPARQSSHYSFKGPSGEPKWLPIKHCIHFKILLITYEALNGLVPQYLSELLLHYSFPVAQMVEHGASNAKIMGSIPRESKSW